MELSYILKGFHRGQRSLCVFLQLLIIFTCSVHSSIPFETAAAERGWVEFEQKRPDGLAIEEVLEAILLAIVQQFPETLNIFFGLNRIVRT